MKHALFAVLLIPAAASASFRGPARIRSVGGALASAPKLSAAGEAKLPDFGALGALMMANPGMTLPHELRDDELERGPAPAAAAEKTVVSDTVASMRAAVERSRATIARADAVLARSRALGAEIEAHLDSLGAKPSDQSGK